MHVAVCIVAFRNSADVLEALSALSRSEYEDFEVVVCENGGERAYRDLLSRVPERLSGGQPVRILLSPCNSGYAGGVNQCIQNADTADVWWVLNPDAVPHPDAMGQLARSFAEDKADALGCTVYYPSGVVESRGGRWRAWMARPEAIDFGRPLGQPSSVVPSEQLGYLSGASMAVTRRFLEVVGMMREDYFLYAEEVEWFLRARQRGMRLAVNPEARVLHHQGSTTGSVQNIRERGRTPVFLDERNKLLVTRDRYPLRLPVAAIAALGLIVLRFGRRAAWKQLGYALAGWLDGVRGRRGRPNWIVD